MKINIEYKDKEDKFPCFFEKIKNKNIVLMYDINTKPFADKIKEKLIGFCDIEDIFFEDKELVPNEKAVSKAICKTKDKDYLLAVGSGTLNDIAKLVSFKYNIESGILATAPSMDGYCSLGAAVIINGKKVTLSCHSPSDVLIDLDIIVNAPQMMIASGFGDILGKFTCLADWKLSNIINGEEINEKAYTLMEEARTNCIATYNGLVLHKKEASRKLMDALITAGLSMAECGNSRPASGSEHHMSHYLEMDFISKNLPVPLHGIKVGIGTLISITLYNYIADNNLVPKYSNEINELRNSLPKVEDIEEMLKGLSSPVKLSEIGVTKDVMEGMIENAYSVRNRYTILTLIHDNGLTEKIKPLIINKYF